ncbi:MAG: type III-B CRISPR module-associated protein Cmr5 [Candidatus Bathyarchaeia archaeon]
MSEKEPAMAWRLVSTLDKEVREKVRDYSRRMAAMMASDGLLPSLAFAYSKATEKTIRRVIGGEDVEGTDERAWALLYCWIIRWLAARSFPVSDKEDVLSTFEKLASYDPSLLSWAGKEAISIVEWIKRFSEGRFE